ncbi:MAG: hypothetical protein HXS50_05280, partial [Theionarchaea archaeon]|nr:hypothetical protein [Theionarchaea archaeon]
PLDSIFHKDRVLANSRLVEALSEFSDRLFPVPIVNPLSPVEESGDYKLLRLTPTYHGYQVGSRSTWRFLSRVGSHVRALFISFRMRDDRLSHPVLRTTPVDTPALVEALREVQGLPVIVNNARKSEIETIIENTGDQVMLDCTWSLPIGFIERMVEEHGDHRLVYGSNVPLHYYQSSLLQLLGADISRKSLERILVGNIAPVLG